MISLPGVRDREKPNAKLDMGCNYKVYGSKSAEIVNVYLVIAVDDDGVNAT